MVAHTAMESAEAPCLDAVLPRSDLEIPHWFAHLLVAPEELEKIRQALSLGQSLAETAA